MSISLSEALLKQQLEFLQSELEEYKRKEENLKKTNESLLKAIGSQSSAPLNTHTINELKKTVDVLQKENSDLKHKIKQLASTYEQEKSDIIMSQKETELALKQQKVAFEWEKINFLAAIQKLEAENTSLSNAAKLKTIEKQTQNENQKYQVSEQQKAFAIEKENLLKENKKIREDSEKALIELKTIYESENEGLRAQIKEQQKKMRVHLNKIEELKEQSSEFMEIKNEELECQVEYYKQLYLTSNKGNDTVKSALDSNEKQKMLGIIQNLNMQKDKLQVELENSQLEVKKVKIDLAKSQEKYWENERNLKNEIKILIGKLMKAKSKLLTEIDLKETSKTNFNRSSSSSRSKNPLYY